MFLEGSLKSNQNLPVRPSLKGLSVMNDERLEEKCGTAVVSIHPRPSLVVLCIWKALSLE